MYSDTGDTTSLVPGFPIRTSSDQRSVDSSPRHIAASHVLHRLLMPRHPPCALKHLQTQENTRTKSAKKAILLKMLATTIQLPNNTPHHQNGGTTPPHKGGLQVLPQDPIVCRQFCCPETRQLLLRTKPTPTTGEDSSRLTPPQRECFRGAP
jgi:hypothetical protein